MPPCRTRTWPPHHCVQRYDAALIFYTLRNRISQTLQDLILRDSLAYAKRGHVTRPDHLTLNRLHRRLIRVFETPCQKSRYLDRLGSPVPRVCGAAPTNGSATCGHSPDGRTSFYGAILRASSPRDIVVARLATTAPMEREPKFRFLWLPVNTPG